MPVLVWIKLFPPPTVRVLVEPMFSKPLLVKPLVAPTVRFAPF